VSAWQLWLIASVILLLAEMFVPSGFFLTAVAIGALAAMVISFLPFGLTAQMLVFAGATLLSALSVRPFLLAHFRLRGGGVRTNVDALIGKSGVVTERIDPGTGKGRVLVGGEDWHGATIDHAVLEPGTRIMVIQVDGTTLHVDKED
jgi:membrane protein implicated in regulation of membrane protease activity